MTQVPGPTSVSEWQPVLLQFYEAGENGYRDEALLELSLASACERHASINGAYMAAWIGSALGPSELAAHLARNSEQFDVLRGRRRRLPLYEPYRMAVLIDDPAAAQFARGFLAETPLWVFVDGAGALRTLDATGAGQEPARVGLGISSKMSAAQGRVSLAKLALLGVVKARAIIPPQVERKLDALLVAAEQVGLFDAEDVVFFALNGLTLSPQWHLHPAAKGCIVRAVDEQAPLAGLLAELPDAVLDEIGAYRAA